ncbi:hypothetical protein GQ457_07G007640 [Hibiscus cannabinus]
MSRNRGNRFGWSERGIGSSGEIVSSGRQGSKGDRVKPLSKYERFGTIFGEVSACCSPDYCNSGVEYRYPIRGIDTQIQHWNLGIGTCLGGYRYPWYRYLLGRVSVPLVSIPASKGVSVPKPPTET